MEIELGIRNVAGAVTFNTDEPADQVGAAIKDRHIIVPADALGYAIIGSETRHAVGFGALN